MDKMKDFIYEISDILFGLLVFGLVIFIFAYQLQDFFSFDIMRPLSVTATSSKVEPASEKSLDAPESSPKENSASVESSENNQKSPSEAVKNSSSEVKVTEGVQSEPAAQTSTPSENVQQETTQSETSSTTGPLSITIPAGSSSDAIASLLYENNVIQSKADFLKVITERNLEKKLKAGTFSIPKGSSLNDVVNIIIK